MFRYLRRSYKVKLTWNRSFLKNVIPKEDKCGSPRDDLFYKLLEWNKCQEKLDQNCWFWYHVACWQMGLYSEDPTKGQLKTGYLKRSQCYELAILRPFLAIFPQTTLSTFTKARFWQTFWDAKHVYILIGWKFTT